MMIIKKKNIITFININTKIMEKKSITNTKNKELNKGLGTVNMMEEGNLQNMFIKKKVVIITMKEKKKKMSKAEIDMKMIIDHTIIIIINREGHIMKTNMKIKLKEEVEDISM